MFGREVLLLLAAIASYSVTDAAALEFNDMMMTGITTCKERFPIPADQLQSFMETQLLKDDNNEAATCFVQCTLEEMGAVKNGAMIVEQMQRLTEDFFRDKKKPDGTPVNVGFLTKNVADCARSETGNMACQKNYRIWKCIQQKGKSEMVM